MAPRTIEIADKRAHVEELGIKAEYGGHLVALSGENGLDGLVHRSELLSPLLAILSPQESLSLEVEYDPKTAALSVGLRGTAIGVSPEEVAARQVMLNSVLEILVRGQMPGFVFRTLAQSVPRANKPGTVTLLRPRGRWIASRRVANDPKPHLVCSNPGGVLLPQITLSPERLAAAIELIRVRGEHAVLNLELRLISFDASALRLLREARDEAVSADPRTTIEAMRQMAEALPDDALMTALLNEGGGVEVRLLLTSRTVPDLSATRMICHAVFGVEPVEAANDNTAELDLSAIYPRGFALSRAVGALAGCALLALKRPPALYDPPAAGGCRLGHTRDGRSVEISERDRARHTYIIGAIGTGKSSLLLNMLHADMQASKGIILLDPHGDLWEEARRCVPAHRSSDVILAHLGEPEHAFTMNVLQGLGGDAAVEHNATVTGLIRLFKNSLWPGVPEAFGPMFEMYFSKALLLLMEANVEKATILDFERIFQDEEFRDELISRCQSQAVRDFWTKTVDRCTHDEISLNNIAPYIICKMSPFTSNALLRPLLGATTSSLDLKLAIGGQKIVLVNLAKGIVGEAAARLVGSLITMRLVAAAQTQMRLPFAERRTFAAYLDEFQTYATEHLAEGIEETRKYRLQLVLANQSLGQIDGRGLRADIGRSIIANVANLISFRLGVEDAHVLARWFQPGFPAEHLMYLPDYTAVTRLLANGQALRPIEFKTCAPPRGKGE